MKNIVQTTLLALALLVPTTGFAMERIETGSTQDILEADDYNDRATQPAPIHLPAAPVPAFLEHQIQLDGPLLIAKTILNNLEKVTAGACVFIAAGIAYWYQTSR